MSFFNLKPVRGIGHITAMQANAHKIVAEGQSLFSELLKVPNQKVEKLREKVLEKIEIWKEKALNFMPKGTGRKIQRELSKLFKKFENFFFKAGKTKCLSGRGVCKITLSKMLSDAFVASLPEEEPSYEELYGMNFV